MSPSASPFDLLLDVLDLGPDLREAIPRLLWGLLWMSPLAGFALGHGRSPCDGSVGERRLSAGVWEKRNPASRHRFFRIAPGWESAKAGKQRDAQPSRQRLHHGVALIAGLARTNKIIGVGSVFVVSSTAPSVLRALLATGTPVFSTFLYQSRLELFGPSIPSSARGIDGGPRHPGIAGSLKRSFS